MLIAAERIYFWHVRLQVILGHLTELFDWHIVFLILLLLRLSGHFYLDLAEGLNWNVVFIAILTASTLREGWLLGHVLTVILARR